jgi:hypothetical protein
MVSSASGAASWIAARSSQRSVWISGGKVAMYSSMFLKPVDFIVLSLFLSAAHFINSFTLSNYSKADD